MTTEIVPGNPKTGLASEIVPDVEIHYDMDNPKYPDVEVQLTGVDGNAGSIMGAVSRALRAHGVGSDEIMQFRLECMSGDYTNLLATCGSWVEVY